MAPTLRSRNWAIPSFRMARKIKKSTRAFKTFNARTFEKQMGERAMRTKEQIEREIETLKQEVKDLQKVIFAKEIEIYQLTDEVEDIEIKAALARRVC